VLYSRSRVRVRRGDARLDLGGVVLPLGLQDVQALRTRLGVDHADLGALAQEHAVHPHIRGDGHGVVVHQVAVADGLLVPIAEDDLLEVAGRVGRRGGRQADLDGVEVVQRIPPDRDLRRRVAPVALVRDHQVEGVDGDVQPVGLGLLVLLGAAEDGGSAEEVDGHPLDRAHVHERQARAGRGEVGGGQDVGVERLALQVLPVEPLAVDLVDVGELPARLRLERGELPDRLGRQRAAIHQEEHPARHPRLHQPVHLIHQRERLAGAGGHGHQHVPLPVREGALDGGVGLDLIGAELGVVVGGVGQARAGGVAVALELLPQGVGRVEVGDPAGAALPVPHVVVPEDLAVRRVEEGHPVAVEVEGARRDAARVALRLRQGVLRAEGELLGLDDAQDAAVHHEGVIGGAVCGGIFLDGERHARIAGAGRVETHDLPAGRPEARVAPLPCPPFAVRWQHPRLPPDSAPDPGTRPQRRGTGRNRGAQNKTPTRVESAFKSLGRLQAHQRDGLR